MKIVIISTADIHGGAAISSYRLLQALNKSNTIVKALVQRKTSMSDLVETTTMSKLKKVLNFSRFAWERFMFFLHEKSKAVRFSFSLGNTGEDISNHPLVLEADIINLHWTNMGFLSLKSIHKLFKLKKPIVWTLHDMWAFTGGCHYVGDCRMFEKSCHHCPFLNDPSIKDLSSKIFDRKKILFEKHKDKITFITSSNWLAEEARKSSLLKDFDIVSIPIPVDTNQFKILNKSEIKAQLGFIDDFKYLLFGAMNINDKRKGFVYFVDSLSILKDRHPELAKRIKLVVFGKSAPESLNQLPFPTINMGFIKSEQILAQLFNAVDLFVMPSIEDNLPNIIMESMACGTPVASFNSGGIPQLIDHKKTGYIAQYKSSDDLAEGIKWCLFDADVIALRNQSRQKALDQYAEDVVAIQYIDKFKDVFEKK